MSNSKYNNTSVPLAIGETFIGLNEIVQPFSTINVSINASTYCLVTIKQTNDQTTFPQIDTYNIDPSTGRFIQEYAKCQYMHIEVQNVDVANQTYLSVLTQFNNLPTEQEDIIISGGTIAVSNIVECDTSNIAGVVETSQLVNQVGSKANLQNATFNPLAQTNVFNCTGYAESTLTYQDTSPANTGDMLIFVRVDGAVADSEVCIGKLIPVVNANGTNRYASTTLNLRGFTGIFIQNNSTTETNTNSIISLFSY
jgi:hypothetical protein